MADTQVVTLNGLTIPWSPQAVFLAQSLMYLKYTSLPALYNQAKLAYEGDPLVGQKLPGTDLDWVKATEQQKFLFVTYSCSGTKLDADYKALVEGNPGPRGGAAQWNNSYDDWGLTRALTA